MEKSTIEVVVGLGLTVSRPVCLSVVHLSGTHDLILIFLYIAVCRLRIGTGGELL
jgi:hypothetical protein